MDEGDKDVSSRPGYQLVMGIYPDCSSSHTVLNAIRMVDNKDGIVVSDWGRSNRRNSGLSICAGSKFARARRSEIVGFDLGYPFEYLIFGNKVRGWAASMIAPTEYS